MSQSPGRPSGSSDARDRLISSARQLFSERGFQSVSTREIARDAKVDAALIRYYFGGKAGLFEQMVRETLAPVLAHFRAASAQGASENLSSLMQTYYSAVGAHPGLPKLVFRVLHDGVGSEPYRILLSVFGEIILMSRRWLSEALVNSGNLRQGVDPDLARLSFVSLMVFPLLAPPVLVRQFGVEVSAKGLSALIPHHLDVIQHGLLQAEGGSTQETGE
ncbi:MAG: TetR/AcrR family transcriptional regulator [Hahellaceae bacterium]|nr:TetR/AcrR family transcriptional regulator [Hahellaceae bacterium]